VLDVKPFVSADAPRVVAAAESARMHRAEARAARRVCNVLMLSDHFRFAYRILRCFHAAGVNVHVLGAKGSRGLRLSRFCASFRERISGYRGHLGPLVREVNSIIAELNIDLIVSGEHFMMRPLIEMAPALNAPCFPMPTMEQFDLLNNKWRFTKLCNDLGLTCPQSRLINSPSELREALEAGDVSIPFVAKPLDFDGSRGFVPVLRASDLRQLDLIDYYPIIIQDYIEGLDVAASVYCDQGEIKAFIAHYRKLATYFTFTSPEIRAGIERIVGATKAHGVLNFDMRIGSDGAVYWLECNPRFFFWMYMSLLAGIPFVEFGLPNWPAPSSTTLPTGTNVRFLKGAAVDLFRPWRLTKLDFRYLLYVLADPVPGVREALGIETV
jgi:predicted ATP-grasp superfamily ATP-dependent carboligase